MPYIIRCKRENRPTMHVVRDNVMSQWGTPLQFADKDDARELASEWASMFKGVHPDYKVVIVAVEAPPARRIIRRSA